MFGIILLQIGILFGAVGFIIEEKFMRRKPDLHPVMIVGVEGVSACIIWIVALTAFQFIPCNATHFCSNGHLEDSYGAIEDYMANFHLIWQSILIIIIIPFSSICGVSTTKNGSSSARITILLARNLVVWIFFMTVPIDKVNGVFVYSERFTWL